MFGRHRPRLVMRFLHHKSSAHEMGDRAWPQVLPSFLRRAPESGRHPRRAFTTCVTAATVVVLAGGLVLGLRSASAAGPGLSQLAGTTTTPNPNAPSGKPLPNDPTVNTIAPICGDQDGSETPLVFNCTSYSQITDRRYYQVPSSGGLTVHFDYVYRDAFFDNELAVFKVDDTNGSINGVLPGDASWPTQVASRNPFVVFPSGSNAFTPDVALNFQGGDILALRFVANAVTYYSFEQANPGGADHMLAFQHSAGQPWQFAWDDSGANQPDNDFNDMIVNISVPPQQVTPTSQSYGPGGCDGKGVNAISTTDCPASDPVNSLTGAFTAAQTDLTEAATGVPFAYTRSYTSADTTVGRLGPGWTDSYSASLAVQPNGDVLVHGEDGQQVYYTKQGDGSFVGAPGALSALSTNAGGYKLVRHDQVTYQFNSSGVLKSELDRNGQGLTFTSDGQGRLSTVTDAASHQMTVGYNASNLVSSVATPDGRTVSYAYTSGRLTSVTLPDPDGGGPLTSPVWTYTYDSGGRLATEVDPNQHTRLTNVYDATTGRVSQQTDANNKTTNFAWDDPTHTATVTDADNHVWKDVYDANNILINRIDATTKTTVLGHDVGLNTTAVTSPNGTDATSMSYDGRANLLTATAPASLAGVQKTFTYDAQNNVSTVTDARGKLTQYGYDTAGNNTSITLDGQQVFGATYNAQGQMLTSTDGNGKTTTYTYDAAGNVASVTAPDPDGAGPLAASRTTYTYDAMGNVLTKVAPLGNCSGCTPANYTTTYTYDKNGHLLTKTDPLGHTTTHTYDAAGNELTVKDANNHTTTYAYDNADHLIQVTGPDPDGAGALEAPKTTYAYDNVGNRLTMVAPRGNCSGCTAATYTTTYTYDANNRLASVTTPKGEKTTYTYDANGNLATMVDPRGNVAGCNCASQYTTTYTYDAAGRLLTTTDQLGNVTTNTYDPVGNVATRKDANNHTTTYSYDAAGRVLTVAAPDTGLTTNTYDGNGNLKTRKDDNNHTTTYSYDDARRLIQVTAPDPDGAGPLTSPVTTYTYDLNGNQATLTDPNGNATPTQGDGMTTYTYDRANRLTNIGYSDTTPAVTYGYDSVGNRTSMTDGSGSVSYIYDNLDRLKSFTRGTNTFSYAYDVASNLTTRTYPDSSVTNTYDEDNRLATVANGGVTVTYAYDPASHLTQATLPSGNGYVETRSYDRAGRLTEVKNQKGASVLSDFVSTLDPVGDPTQIVQTGAVSATQTYTYDANDRILSVCFQAGTCPGGSDPFIRWSYDKVGNRLTEARPGTSTVNYTYNGLDELTQAGTTSYSYDQNGNETAAGATTMSYDLANRPKTLTSGSTTTTYSYDGDGTRLQASTGTQAAQKTNYLWDVNNPLPMLAIERDGANALLRRYVYGQRLISMTTGGSKYYYHFDTLGSMRNLTSSGGNSQWTDTYEPYGGIRTETKNNTGAPTNMMKFAAEYNDPTGLYSLRARQYDPAIGRFLRPDPVLTSLDRPVAAGYEYAADRPTVLVDPSGLTSQPASPTDAGPAAADNAASNNQFPEINGIAWCVNHLFSCETDPLRNLIVREVHRIDHLLGPCATGAYSGALYGFWAADLPGAITGAAFGCGEEVAVSVVRRVFGATPATVLQDYFDIRGIDNILEGFQRRFGNHPGWSIAYLEVHYSANGSTGRVIFYATTMGR